MLKGTRIMGDTSSACTCPVCKLIINDEDPNSIECDGCVKWIHRKCAGVADSVFAAISEHPGQISWFCVKCVDESKNVKPNQFNKLMEMLNAVRMASESTNAEMRSLKKQQAKLSKDFANFSSTISENIKKEVALEVGKVGDKIDKVKESVAILDDTNQKKLALIDKELDKFQRLARRNDILVNGIPASCTDLCKIFIDICKVFKCDIENSDISSCFRLGGKNNVILVKISSVQKRDHIMKSYRAFGMLKLSHVLPALKIESRIYLNDNMSPMMASMFKFAKFLRTSSFIMSFSIGNGFINVIDGNNVKKKFYSLLDLKNAFPRNNSTSYSIPEAEGINTDILVDAVASN